MSNSKPKAAENPVGAQDPVGETPDRPSCVTIQAFRPARSIGNQAIYITEQISAPGAKRIATPDFDAPLGGHMVVAGVKASVYSGKAQISVAVSLDGVAFSQAVAQAEVVAQAGLNVVVLNLKDYKAPFYRLYVDFDEKLRKDAVICLQFVVTR